MSSRVAFKVAFLVLAVSSLPAAALAQGQPLTPVGVFFDAAPPQKLFMAALIVAILAAATITARKALSGPSLAGGSAYVSGLRLGGPLIGLLGAIYSALNCALGVTNIQPDDLRVIAPGVAECFLALGLGILAGTVAVFCHWIIEARIDRTVLEAA